MGLNFMINGVASWHCKCGVTVKVITETDRTRINEDIRHEPQCPNCGDKQIVYAHRVLKVAMYIDETETTHAKGRSFES
jgi:hypothetical protein